MKHAIQPLALDVGGYTLAALRWGAETGRPVIALHGWLDNAASFVPLAPHLENLQLVALELGGHGHSDWRPGFGHYHFMDYVDEVLNAADALGWRRFTLLGHSLGAAIAPLVAVAAADRVERLVLIEGLGPLSEEPELLPDRLVRARRQLMRHARRKAQVYARVEEAALRRKKNTDLSLTAARLLAGRGTRPVEGGVAWRHDPRLLAASPGYFTEEQVMAVLSALDVPTLLLTAEEGRLMRRDNFPARCGAVSGLHRVTLPGGHHLHMDDPAACAGPINEFLRE